MTLSLQGFNLTLYSTGGKRISIYSLKKRHDTLQAPWTSQTHRILVCKQKNILLLWNSFVHKSRRFWLYMIHLLYVFTQKIYSSFLYKSCRKRQCEKVANTVAVLLFNLRLKFCKKNDRQIGTRKFNFPLCNVHHTWQQKIVMTATSSSANCLWEQT